MVDRRRSTIPDSAVSEMSIGSAAPVVVLLVKVKEVRVESGSRGESRPQSFANMTSGLLEA